jgi:ribonuclease I
VDIGDDVRASLQSMMSDASIMGPHEWYAHGTCSGVTPDVFFGDAVTLVEQARTVLDPMFADAEEGRIKAERRAGQAQSGVRRRSGRSRPSQLSQYDRSR